jgi:hypothetical protein
VSKYLSAFNSRNDLKDKYGSNSLLLYVLQLRFDIEDIFSVAAESLTDGGNDKKCDLIYLDRDSGIAVIAQAYMRKNPNESDLAPCNKASDLNTAVAWVFKQDISDIPDQIRDAVSALRDAIKDGDINSIYFWYVHNLNQKNNLDVREELMTVQQTAQQLIRSVYVDTEIRVAALEVGNEQIEEWYENSAKRIVIDEDLNVITILKGFEIDGSNWKAYVTAVSGRWLRDLYLLKKDDLFSGNPRNFLGAGKRKNKINLGIKNTVQEESNNFWAYNNGITALVNEYNIDESGNLLISGITIINGAQTTGAIGSVENFVEDFWVPIRFIICQEPKIIDEIVSNNNKQNEILPSDLRSNDKQQERLRNEFDRFPHLSYNGGRRSDKRPRNKAVFDPYVVGQTLLAFHKDPVFAYDKRKEIWDDDTQYAYVFCDQLSAEHIVFLYSLSRAIDEYKLELNSKQENRTDNENRQFSFMSKRGSKMLLIYCISASLENIFPKKISDKWKLQFKENMDFDQQINLWKQLLKSTIPFCNYLLPALEGGLNNREKVRTSSEQFSAALTALKDLLREQLRSFIGKIRY